MSIDKNKEKTIMKKDFADLLKAIKTHSGDRAKTKDDLAAVDKVSYYTDEHKRGLKKDITDAQTARAEAARQDIDQRLQQLREATAKATGDFDLNDPQLEKSLAIVQSTGGRLTPDMQKQLVEGLRGKMPALGVLKGAFEKNGLGDTAFAGALFSPEERIAGIEQKTLRAYRQNGSLGVLAEDIAQLAIDCGLTDVEVPSFENETSAQRVLTETGMF